MSPIYSKRGCIICKQRRKKCDEQKPICASCARLNLPCGYNSNDLRQTGTRGASTLGVFETEIMPPSVDEPITDIKIHNSAEAAALTTAPKATLAFFAPACTLGFRDFAELWQMTLSDGLVRSSMVACFSHVLGRSGSFGNMDEVAYGSALRRVYAKSNQVSLGDRDLLVMLVGINFLGLIDSAGDALEGDPLVHFKAMCAFIARARDSIRWTSLPAHVCTLILESVAYNLTSHAMFSRELEGTRSLWRKARIIESLELVNPPGPQRIPRSPLVSGQYWIFGVIFELVCLHRFWDGQSGDVLRVRELESAVRAKISSMDGDLKAVQRKPNPLPAERYSVLYRVYSLAYNAALICTIALQDQSLARSDEIDRLACDSLETFLTMPLISMRHAVTMWSLQIVGCTLRRDSDLEALLDYWRRFREQLDAGHRRRTDRLFDMVKCLREKEQLDSEESQPSEPTNDTAVDSGAQAGDCYSITVPEAEWMPRSPALEVIGAKETGQYALPVGLYLLRKKNGVLS